MDGIKCININMRILNKSFDTDAINKRKDQSLLFPLKDYFKNCYSSFM